MDLHPPEWVDSQAMDVLFSPFRESREVNPSSWDRKMIFWKSMIARYCKVYHTAVFDSKALATAFQREGKSPVCLENVFADMTNQGKIKKLEDVLTNLSSGWLSWTIGLLVKKPIQWTVGTFVKKPLSWTFSKVFGSSGNAESTVQFVHMDHLKAISDEILQLQSKSVKSEITDCVIGYEELKTHCTGITKDETTFHIAILFLCNQNKCSVSVTENQEKVLSFQRQGPQSPVSPKNLSESDMKIYKLKLTEKQLMEQIGQLSGEMEKLRREAKSNLQRGEKIAAKNCLRRKKKSETWKHSKEEALENIRHLISIIQQAETNKMIVDAYSSGVSAYNDIRQKYGLTTDRIDNVMDNVQDAYDVHNQLDESMSQNPLDGQEPSTEELEIELKELMEGSGDSSILKPPESDPQQDLINALCTMRIKEDGPSGADEFGLPNVPSHDLGSPQKPVGFTNPSQNTSPRQREKAPVLG